MRKLSKATCIGLLVTSLCLFMATSVLAGPRDRINNLTTTARPWWKAKPFNWEALNEKTRGVSFGRRSLSDKWLAGPREEPGLGGKRHCHGQGQGPRSHPGSHQDKNGPFVKGDLYVFAGSTDKAELIAHPLAPQLMGKDMSQMKDVNGKFFQMEFMNVAKDPGQGWVEYSWPKPGTTEPAPKDTFIMKVPDNNVWFGCGYYK